MFANWVNPAELLYVFRKIREDPKFLGRFTSALSRTQVSRVKESWSEVQRPGNWWEVPAVQRRWNMLISGDPSKVHYTYIAEKYLSGRNSLRGLSLGCGDGQKERRWCDAGSFSRIDAYDISDGAIKIARGMNEGTKYANVVNFQAADISTLELQPNSYDVVIFEHSLHHFSHLEPLLLRVSSAMKPNALLLVNEFIGPSRFQWTDRQLEIVNGVLKIFPKRYLKLSNSALSRVPAWRPSKLWMLLSDPSEAAESSRILPLLKKNFTIVEHKGYGGAVLHLLLSGIAHHFTTTDPDAQNLLRWCFEVEDMMLANHEIEHDFALLVCRK